MNTNENQKSAESQCNVIAEALLSGRRLTMLDALQEFKCERLSARILDLKRKYGMNIVSHRIKVPSGKWVAEYYIPGQMSQMELFA